MNIFKQQSLLTQAIANGYLSSVNPKRYSVRKTIHELQHNPDTGFFADSLLQHKFGYDQVKDSFEEVADNLNIHPKLVDNMHTSGVYRREWYPFEHQQESWKALSAKDVHSILVSSGTGSGKTECFMVPMISDFAHQADHLTQGLNSLVGIQALMIYPLNALSESQKDRLNGYLTGFGQKVRYAQYNGDTPEEAPQRIRNDTPHQLIDRKQIREEPPPILLTNTTMLELMLKRPKDASILEQSQGTLKYIVLDEAHTYLGSQAAELALLLRRVLIAFNVEPQNVRFIATSATLSSASEDEARQELTRLLADISGQEQSQVKVFFGRPHCPPTNTPKNTWNDTYPKIEGLNIQGAGYKQQLFDLLKDCTEACAVQQSLIAQEQTFASLLQNVQQHHPTIDREILERILELGAIAYDDDSAEFFCPLRIHLFQRTQGQLWACSNRSCTETPTQLNDDPQWFFGPIFNRYEHTCPHCQSKTFELVVCASCGQDYIKGFYRFEDASFTPSEPSMLESWNSDQEFEREQPADDESETSIQNDEPAENPAFVLTRTSDILFSDDFDSDIERFEEQDIQFGSLNEDQQEFTCLTEYADDKVSLIKDAPMVLVPVRERRDDNQHRSFCPCCHDRKSNESIFWSARRGQKYGIRINLPLFLKCLPSSEFNGENDVVGDGKQLLSFTDSRSGTANYAMTIQSDMERMWVRSFLLHKTVEVTKAGNRATIPTLIEYLRNSADLRALDLFKRTFLGDTYGNAFPDENDLTSLAKIMFMTFMTRYGQSAERVGLLEFRYDAVDNLNFNTVPAVWNQQFETNQKSLDQWKNFIYIFIDIFLRQKQIISLNDIPNPILKRRVFDAFVNHKRLDVGDNVEINQNSKQRRPSWTWTDSDNRTHIIHHPSKVVQILVKAFDLSSENQDHLDFVNTVVAQTIQLLKQLNILTAVLGDPAQGWALNIFNAGIYLAPTTHAFFCPTKRSFVNRVLSVKGRTISTETPSGPPPQQIQLPATITKPFPTPMESLEIEQNLCSCDDIKKARYHGQWSSLSDKLLAYTPYIQTAEHSAGLDTDMRKRTEQWFREGRLNVLFCSTTMEMGVDIGGLHGVINSNVPPMASNYLQRIGRAGRRGEGLSLSLTLCKNMPHDRLAYHNPRWAFTQDIVVTQVKLDSRDIVQRHCNAFLLGEFLRQQPENANQDNQWFFFDGGNPNPPVQQFADFLNTCAQEQRIQQGLSTIVRHSVIENLRPHEICEHAHQQIEDTHKAFTVEFNHFKNHLTGLNNNDETWFATMFPSIETFQQQAIIMQMQQSGTLTAEQALKLSPTPQLRYLPNPDKILQTPAQKAIKAQFRLFLQGQLEAFLAKHQFLSGNMQANGIVEFDYRSMSELQNARQRSKLPSRALPIAIREYAPGADVVRQGRVHRSAGVLLKWFQPPNLHPDTTEEIKRYCKTCLNTQWDTENKCTVCRETHWLKVFVPNTFCVDLQQSPSLQLQSPRYLSINDPIPAMQGQWSYFGGFELRTSKTAHILHYNRGINHLGYALCLVCGRAEAETDVPIEDTNGHHAGNLPTQMVNHARLRRGTNPNGTPGVNCQGNTENYALQRYINLGGTTTTHGFEVKIPLRNGEFSEDSTVLTSVGNAMKTALARMIGVESSELGMHPTQNSILIYDCTEGGAGFTTQAPNHFRKLLTETINVLECPTQRCAKACEGCLINYGTQYSIEKLDRHQALEIIRPAVDSLVDLKELFLQGVGIPHQISDRLLWHKLLEQSRTPIFTDGKIRIYIHGQTMDEFSWTTWLFSNVLTRLTQSIELVFDAQLFEELSTDSQHTLIRNNLHGYILQHPHITAYTSTLPDLGVDLKSSEFYVWAELISQDNKTCHRFTSTDDQLVQVSGEWLDTQVYMSIEEAREYYHFWYQSDISEPYYNPTTLILWDEQISKDHIPPSKFNCLWSSITANRQPRTFRTIEEHLLGVPNSEDQNLSTVVESLEEMIQKHGLATQFSYTDRYIKRPLEATVLYYTLKYFKYTLQIVNKNTRFTLRTLCVKPGDRYYQNTYVQDWMHADKQRAFLEGISEAIFINPTVKIIQQRSEALPHSRYFEFVWEGDQQIRKRIYLDQGLAIYDILRAKHKTIESYERIDPEINLFQKNDILMTLV